MTALHIDFETRSVVDLPKTNVYIYAAHPLTDVWCAQWALGDGPVNLWTPDQPCPEEIFDHALAGGEFVAHNAQFERVIWRDVLAPRRGWPALKIEQWRCTMVECYAMNLPGSLENAAGALGLDIRKDMAGRRLMLQMSKPRRMEGDTPVWWDDEDRKQRLYAYCGQDVEVERQIDKRVLRLRPEEREAWLLDQKINDRGVFIDADLCRKAKKIVSEASRRIDEEIREVTDGAVTAATNVSQLIAWLQRQGVEADSVAKGPLDDLLARDTLPDAARRALELRRDGAKASVAKIDAMLARRNADGRMRGNLQFIGASQTGRWAGRGAQLQNLPRPVTKDPDTLVRVLQCGSYASVEALYDQPLQAVSDAIRSLITAQPGRTLMDVDFANIEGRVVAWLAGERGKLQRFREYDAGTGPDIYLVAAAGIYNVPVADAKPHRQVGKVSELALGYQGGPGAFAKMASGYGLKVADAFGPVWESAAPANREAAKDAWDSRGKQSGMSREAWLAAELIKLAWRQQHQRIVEMWAGLEAAALDAVRAPGQTVTWRALAYKMAGSFLFCRLPSGRFITYPYPRIVEKETPWGTKVEGLVFKSVDQFTKKWGDKDFYGGLATENVVQAVARDIMKDAMLRVETAGFPVVLTVHDEIVTEPKEGADFDLFKQLMAETPAWAAGLPIAVDGWVGQRYRK